MRRIAQRVLLPGVAALWLLSAAAAAGDLLPPHLTGVWGTASSLYAGTTEQRELHLQADGFGLLVGSTPPAVRLDGKDDGKPAPRAVLGFPVRATLDGRTLTVQPFMPGSAPPPPMSCRYLARTTGDGQLACTGPGADRAERTMKRLTGTLPADTLRMLGAIRAQHPTP